MIFKTNSLYYQFSEVVRLFTSPRCVSLHVPQRTSERRRAQSCIYGDTPPASPAAIATPPSLMVRLKAPPAAARSRPGLQGASWCGTRRGRTEGGDGPDDSRWKIGVSGGGQITAGSTPSLVNVAGKIIVLLLSTQIGSLLIQYYGCYLLDGAG